MIIFSCDDNGANAIQVFAASKKISEINCLDFVMVIFLF